MKTAMRLFAGLLAAAALPAFAACRSKPLPPPLPSSAAPEVSAPIADPTPDPKLDPIPDESEEPSPSAVPAVYMTSEITPEGLKKAFAALGRTPGGQGPFWRTGREFLSGSTADWRSGTVPGWNTGGNEHCQRRFSPCQYRPAPSNCRGAWLHGHRSGRNLGC